MSRQTSEEDNKKALKVQLLAPENEDNLKQSTHSSTQYTNSDSAAAPTDARDIVKKSFLERLFSGYYIFFACLSALFFGTFNFIQDGFIKESMSLRVMYLAGVGCIAYFLIFHIYASINLKNSKGHFWSKQDSAYFKEDGSIDWLLVKIILSRSLFSIMLIALIYAVMYTSKLSAISSSVIISLYAGNVLTTSFAFNLVFNERLSAKHLFGMISIIVSIVFISFGKSSKQDSTDTDSSLTQDDRMSILIPICLAIIACLTITSQSIVTRLVRRTKITSAQYTADSQFLSNGLLCIMAVYEHNWVEPYETTQMWILIANSFLQIVGLLCLNGAIIFGKAGPCQALIQMQSPIQLAFEILILMLVPNGYALIGMLISIIGAIIIIFGK